jgi:Phage integrase, N-terminal SAM-like domain
VPSQPPSVEARSNVRPATSARIASYLRVQIMPAFGEVALGKINRLSVQSWIDSMAQVLGSRTVRDASRYSQVSCARQYDRASSVSLPATRSCSRAWPGPSHAF